MLFKNSVFFNTLDHKEITFAFGTYYFLKNFVISEVNEGEDFTWEKAKQVIDEILKFYKKNTRICFIINRVNKYSVDPQNWIKAQKKHQFMAASAIVTYNNTSYKVTSLEKYFSELEIKNCESLDKAIIWTQSLELNK